jgi:peptidoglycan/xylan/chitin deacetylase (PgdA/CDA1 family)
MEAVRRLAALLVLALPSAAFAAVTDGASRGRSAGEVAVERLARKGVAVYCADRSSRLVALTFDDGPGVHSRAIAAALRRARARATFFLVGQRLAWWRGALRAEASVGAVGDHTWSHVSLAALGPAGLRAEVGRTRAAEIARTGRRIALFRPPYGVRTSAGDAYVRKLGMLQILWDVEDSRSGIRGGSIVLLHETRPQALPLLRSILRDLARRRLRAVTVPELLAHAPPPLVRDARGLRTGC